MRIFIAIAMLVFACCAQAQNNIFATFGIAATVGPPAFAPGPRGSIVAIDTATGLWWINTVRSSASAWSKMGHRLQERPGCSAPSAPPGKYESWFVSNTCSAPKLYLWDGVSAWDCLNCTSGGGGSVETDATLTGDGTTGNELGIAQQGASTSQVLEWTGAKWEPSWGNPYIYVTSGSTITTEVNEILIGTLSANITLGLPTCNADTDQKHFKFVRNGSDSFSMTIDPAGAQTFQDGTSTKIQYGKLSIDCTCRFSGGTGVWFFDNF